MAYLDLRDLSKELADLRDIENVCEGGETRLAALEALEDQLNGDLEEYARKESTLIPESEFVEDAEDFAYDSGMIERDSSVACYVDWERWADALKMDYTSVDFDGETYLIRDY